MDLPRSIQVACVALLAIVALGVAALWVSLRDVHHGIVALQTEDVDVSVEQPELTRSNVTFEKTLEDGKVVTLTCTQQVGESYEDFVARCRKEWKTLCEELGG